MPAPEGAVALLGDAHLREGDPEVDAFVEFLDSLPPDVRTLAILGDLFAVWVGAPDLQQTHHRRVLEALRRLRRRGCGLLYVEGNHDFYLKPLFFGDPFDLLEEESVDLRLGGLATHLAHGDLVNTRDRQYRAWRRISKSRPFRGAFNLLPARLRQRIAGGLEARLRHTNLEFRGGFPYRECESYARARLREGAEVLVFGHFHEEIRREYEEGGRRGTVYVLPAWRAGHRYLRLAPGAAPAFVSA
ncbi:MAG: UDP-2,3-diacylglucosamine diphosphatase [Candidatus Polarisedimenticolia bacterium]